MNKLLKAGPFLAFTLAFLPAVAQENTNKPTKNSRPFIKGYQIDTLDVMPEFPGGEKQ